VDLVECPREPALGEGLDSWVEQWKKAGVEVNREKPLPSKGFQVPPRR
jgi:hypothetical protein